MSAIGYDEEWALSQGWKVGERKNSTGSVPVILAQGNSFFSHREALCFVARDAISGSAPHRAVMDAIFEQNPAEFWDGMAEASRFEKPASGGLMSFVEARPRSVLYAAAREWEALRSGERGDGTLMGLVRDFTGEAGVPAGRDPMELMGQIIAQTRTIMANELGDEFAFSGEDTPFPPQASMKDLITAIPKDLLDVARGAHGGEIPDGLYINEIQPGSEVILVTGDGEQKVWVQSWIQVNEDTVFRGRRCDGDLSAGQPIAFRKEHILDFAETSPHNERDLKSVGAEITF